MTRRVTPIDDNSNMRNNNNNKENKMVLNVQSRDDEKFVAWSGTHSEFKRDFPQGLDKQTKKGWCLTFAVSPHNPTADQVTMNGRFNNE